MKQFAQGSSAGFGQQVLTYSFGKFIFIALALVAGLLYALPNYFPDVPVVQIAALKTGEAIPAELMSDIEAELKSAQLSSEDVMLEEGKGTLVFDSTETQLRAKDLLSDRFADQARFGLNLMPTTPQWLADLGAKPMTLGLDLQGGVHFLLEVDLDSAVNNRLKAYQEEAREGFREQRLYYSKQAAAFDEAEERWTVWFEFTDEKLFTKAKTWAKENLNDLTIDSKTVKGVDRLQMSIPDPLVERIKDDALSQNLTTLRNRVNELGVAEPLVQRQGTSRIVVELPGVQDTTEASRILGKTANLEFRLVNMEASPLSTPGGDSERFNFRSQANRTTVLYRAVIATGDRVLDAHSGSDDQGMPQVSIVLDSQGGKRMLAATKGNIGNDMAVLFIEQRSEFETLPNGEVKRTAINDKGVINQATIRDALGNRFVITGLDSRAEASELALLLRAGALAAPMYLIEESTIGPSLGAENIQAGLNSALLGLAAVMVFMVLVYKVFGLVANIALGFNIVLLIAILSVFSATLTLPGIAGVVLTVGMAVDANVLIFARIREELASGLEPVEAVRAGYDRAFVTILDANLTTFIVALILFLIGSGPIKGFAVTLSIGIVTSMFTAVSVSRALITLIYGRRPLDRILI